MDTELTGLVTEQGADGRVSEKGLYLKTDDGEYVELITGMMAQQLSLAMMWEQSRRDFEPYLGRVITVQGYLAHSRLYSATPVGSPVS